MSDPSEQGQKNELNDLEATEDRIAQAEETFKNILSELVGDQSLERFRVEYEKVHRALKKSHESENRLIKRCRELNNEIVTNAAKVQTALKLSQEDQKTIQSLRKELEKSWKMVDLSHQKEVQAKDTIQKLKVEIANLSRLVEQGTGLASGQEHSVKELLKMKDSLTRERDEARKAAEDLKNEMKALNQQIEAVQKEKLAILTQAKELQTQLGYKSAETTRESGRRAVVEAQLRDLKAVLNDKIAELNTKYQETQRMANEQISLERQLRDQTDLTEKAKKENEELQRRLLKLSSDLEEELQRNTILSGTISVREGELRRLDENVRVSEEKVARAQALHRRAEERVLVLEASLEQSHAQREALKNENNATVREMEALKKTIAQNEKSMESAQRERELLGKKMQSVGEEKLAEAERVRASEQAKQSVESELEGYKRECQTLRKDIYRLERERESRIAETQSLRRMHEEAMEEVKIREGKVAELQKRIVETEQKVTQQKVLYEQIRSEKNQFSKSLIEAQDAHTEMQRKTKLLHHQLEQLKEEQRVLQQRTVSERYQHARAAKEAEGYARALVQSTQQSEAAERTIAAQQDEVAKLTQIITDSETDSMRLRKQLNKATGERDVLLSQLVRRNDELELVYRKLALHQQALAKGESQYGLRVDDIRVLKNKVNDITRELTLAKVALPKVETLRAEVLTLHRELTQERNKVKALSDELQTPLNIHRWRKLEGSDPTTLELIERIQTLQKRLIKKTEQTMTKDSFIAELQEKLKQFESEGKSSRSATSQQNAALVTKYRLENKASQERIKGLTAELNMCQVQLADLQSEVDSLARALTATKKLYFETKKREHLAREREKAITDAANAKRAAMLYENESGQVRFAGGGFAVNRRVKKTNKTAVIKNERQHGNQQKTDTEESTVTEDQLESQEKELMVQ